MGVRVVEGNVKADVLSCGVLGAAASKSKKVRVASKSVNRGMWTWVFTSAAAIWLRAASSTATYSLTKLQRPAPRR